MDLAVQGKNESDSMLGHGVGRIARYTRYGDAQFLGGLQIDIVKSRTTQSNQPDARTCQAFEDLAVQNIIYKCADRLRPVRGKNGFGIQPEFLKTPIQFIRATCACDIVPVVGLGIKDRDGRLFDSHQRKPSQHLNERSRAIRPERCQSIVRVRSNHPLLTIEKTWLLRQKIQRSPLA